MNVEMIKELMQAFKEAELTDLSLKCDEFELTLGKKSETVAAIAPTIADSSRVNAGVSAMQNSTIYAGKSIVNDQHNQNGGSDVVVPDQENNKQELTRPTKAIKAPIVGTFYRAGSPNGEPFVKVGSYVRKGDVVCVIEAMKLMNEVEAEEEGEVVEILVQNEDMVEYNQPLIVLR